MISALEDCSISVMTQEAFNSLAQHNVQALMPSYKILAKRLRSNMRLVEDLQDGSKHPSASLGRGS